jgi:hypothetical protein
MDSIAARKINLLKQPEPPEKSREASEKCLDYHHHRELASFEPFSFLFQFFLSVVRFFVGVGRTRAAISGLFEQGTLHGPRAFIEDFSGTFLRLRGGITLLVALAFWGIPCTPLADLTFNG